jgi:hypothetical protein
MSGKEHATPPAKAREGPGGDDAVANYSVWKQMDESWREEEQRWREYKAKLNCCPTCDTPRPTKSCVERHRQEGCLNRCRFCKDLWTDISKQAAAVTYPEDPAFHRPAWRCLADHEYVCDGISRSAHQN